MDLLSDILNQMKLAGTLYFRTAFTPDWAVEVPAYNKVARFHFVHRGRCYARVDSTEKPVLLEQGDLIIIPHGARHILSDPVEVDALTVDEVVAKSSFNGSGALVYGSLEPSHATQFVCGHFAFDEDVNHPLIDSLPAFIRIREQAGVSNIWLDSTLKVIGAETGRGGLGSDLIALKLSEIILAQAIRTFLDNEGKDMKVFAAFADPAISRALEALHRAPTPNWTLKEMAREAGMSRTLFAAKFSKLMMMTPLGYLTAWRIQSARRLLLETDAPIIEVAEQSGYSSEASFGRVFKRRFNVPPARYRRAGTAPQADARS